MSAELIARRLHEAVSAVCPIISVSIVNRNDKNTWSVVYHPSATAPQISAAQSTITSFDNSQNADNIYISQLDLLKLASLKNNMGIPQTFINTLKKTSNQIINTISYQNVTDLGFNVNINTNYAFRFYVAIRSTNTATGYRVSVNGPVGGVVDYNTRYQTVANASGLATWLDRHDITYEAMPVLASSVVANADMLVIIEGRLINSTTEGTLNLVAASEAANNNIIIQEGSWGIWF